MRTTAIHTGSKLTRMWGWVTEMAIYITTLYGKTHLKLIFFNYLELFVSNAKLVYSLWYRVSWATSKTSLSTSFIEPKLFDKLQVFFCLLFNAEKIGKNTLSHAFILGFKWLGCTMSFLLLKCLSVFSSFVFIIGPNRKEHKGAKDCGALARYYATNRDMNKRERT